LETAVAIRESIAKHQKLSAVGSGTVLIGAILFCVWNQRAQTLSPPTRWYFTVDHGKTWFVDDINKVPPFEHKGQQAYRARIFTCDGGSTEWCGYIERCNPKVKAKVDESVARGVPMRDLIRLITDNMEVQRPERPDSAWVPSNKAREYAEVTGVKCPNDPNNYPIPVVP
jgi:hypothetical protein